MNYDGVATLAARQERRRYQVWQYVAANEARLPCLMPRTSDGDVQCIWVDFVECTARHTQVDAQSLNCRPANFIGVSQTIDLGFDLAEKLLITLDTLTYGDIAQDNKRTAII